MSWGTKLLTIKTSISCMVYLECESSTGSADLCAAAGVVQSHRDDLLKELIVRHAAVLGGVSKVFLMGDLRIRVRFE